jgi:hypothetical protein
MHVFSACGALKTWLPAIRLDKPGQDDEKMWFDMAESLFWTKLESNRGLNLALIVVWSMAKRLSYTRIAPRFRRPKKSNSRLAPIVRACVTARSSPDGAFQHYSARARQGHLGIR